MAPIFSASENISSSSYTFSEQNSEFLTQSAVHSFVQICQNGERGGGVMKAGVDSSVFSTGDTTRKKIKGAAGYIMIHQGFLMFLLRLQTPDGLLNMLHHPDSQTVAIISFINCHIR